MWRSLGTRLLPIYICRVELLNISNWSAHPQVELIITDRSSGRGQKMLSQSLECHGRGCQCKLSSFPLLLSWTSSQIHPTIFCPVHFLDIFLTCIAVRGQIQKQIVLHIGDIICHYVFILKQLKTGGKDDLQTRPAPKDPEYPSGTNTQKSPTKNEPILYSPLVPISYDFEC